ncbi:MAG TPA: PspC domain-containing protein [Sphingomicrobium sp.]|nr:PspC domain-containing protein [Sphingomicrobium sp.]
MQDSIDAMNDQQADHSNQPDFMFGVCEAIGEDLGFDPFYLRVALLGLLFFSPLAMLASYALLSGAVALSRWLFPRPALTVAVPDAAPRPATELQPELIAA